MNGVDPYHQFVALHKNQLESSVVPEHFWPTLFKKTTEDVSLILFIIFKPIHLYVLKHQSFYISDLVCRCHASTILSKLA